MHKGNYKTNMGNVDTTVLLGLIVAMVGIVVSFGFMSGTNYTNMESFMKWKRFIV